MAGIQKTNPHFWFSNNAEEAVGFHQTVFNNSKTGHVSRYTKEGFDVQSYAGGHRYVNRVYDRRTGVSRPKWRTHLQLWWGDLLPVHCDDQKEIGHCWEKLSAGGQKNAQ